MYMFLTICFYISLQFIACRKVLQSDVIFVLVLYSVEHISGQPWSNFSFHHEVL